MPEHDCSRRVSGLVDYIWYSAETVVCHRSYVQGSMPLLAQ